MTSPWVELPTAHRDLCGFPPIEPIRKMAIKAGGYGNGRRLFRAPGARRASCRQQGRSSARTPDPSRHGGPLCRPSPGDRSRRIAGRRQGPGTRARLRLVLAAGYPLSPYATEPARAAPHFSSRSIPSSPTPSHRRGRATGSAPPVARLQRTQLVWEPSPPSHFPKRIRAGHSRRSPAQNPILHRAYDVPKERDDVKHFLTHLVM